MEFHAAGDDGVDLYRAGEALANRLAGPGRLDSLVQSIIDVGFEWGVSDGN